MTWLLVPLLLGVSFSFWSAVGLVRWLSRTRVSTSGEGFSRHSAPAGGPRLTPADVAVLVPAHNEETGIAATIASVLRLVPAPNIHIIADGCEDNTATIASSYGVNVLVLNPGRGKAGGLVAALEHFEIERHFDVLLIVDADTELAKEYLTRGLRLLDDQEMAAVAGYALSSWSPRELTLYGRLLTAYRARLYAVMQWMKYAQTWRYTNVTPIVPGFASMYRTRVLSQIDIDAPDLVIEDFNMTFELRHKRLGKVALDPRVSALTQDPENFPDYFRQVSRWQLGLLQTIRRHGVWLSGFWAALGLFLCEVVIASIVLVGLVVGLIVVALHPVIQGVADTWPWYVGLDGLLTQFLSPLNLLLLVVVPDYLLTCLSAAYLRRPSLLVYGPVFVVVRLVDAVATLRSFVTLLRASSNGRWTSPTRRPLVLPVASASPLSPGGRVDDEVADAAKALGAGSHGLAVVNAPAGGSSRGRDDATRLGRAAPVARDAMSLLLALALLSAVVLAGIPVQIAIIGGLAALLVGGFLAVPKRWQRLLLPKKFTVTDATQPAPLIGEQRGPTSAPRGGADPAAAKTAIIDVATTAIVSANVDAVTATFDIPTTPILFPPSHSSQAAPSLSPRPTQRATQRPAPRPTARPAPQRVPQVLTGPGGRHRSRESAVEATPVRSSRQQGGPRHAPQRRRFPS